MYHQWYIHLAVVWVLVMGCVHPNSGPEEKLRGIASAFTELGCLVRCEIVRPDRTAPRRVAALLGQMTGNTPAGQGLVLLRSHWSLPGARGAIRRLRESGHTVVIDIPTPVTSGIREITRAPRPPLSRAGRLLVETIWTPSAWPAADLVVQYAPDYGPWRLLAAERRLTLTNGVNVGGRPLAADWAKRSGVTFVCAGALGPWHGLDRLVRGMGAATDVPSRLLVVGDGPERPRLQALANEMGLAGRVQFLGSRSGSALTEVMSAADVGVASLAEHRRGGVGLSPLKTRDYLARGMPVIFAGDDPDLRSDPPFTLRVADDNSDVDVLAVRRWLDGMRAQVQQTVEPAAVTVSPVAIRSFAEQNLQWRTRAEAILAAVADRSGR